MKILITLILCHFIGYTAFSQEAENTVIAIDSSTTLYERSINNNLTEKYNGDNFNYDTKTGESLNLLTRFINWVSRGLKNVFGVNIPPRTLEVIQYLIYVLMGIGAIYLLVKLVINEKFSFIFSKKAKTIFDIDLAEQHIESLDLDKLLDTALAQKDYRLAIRYHFLKTLKKLSQQDIIEWHFDKTNSDYQNEIKEQNLQYGFKEIAYIYDYIWYGEQPINEVKYDTAKARFVAMNNLILK